MPGRACRWNGVGWRAPALMNTPWMSWPNQRRCWWQPTTPPFAFSCGMFSEPNPTFSECLDIVPVTFVLFLSLRASARSWPPPFRISIQIIKLCVHKVFTAADGFCFGVRRLNELRTQKTTPIWQTARVLQWLDLWGNVIFSLGKNECNILAWCISRNI